MIEITNTLCNQYIPYEEVPKLLRSDIVKEIRIFALGPKGTNISKAAKLWAEKYNLINKAKIILCKTPEEEVREAMKIEEEGVIPIFALCAVYYDLCKLFFEFGSNYTFLHHFYMPLDNMQLASKEYTLETLPSSARVAAHYSPSVLLENTSLKIDIADSNAAAAIMCAEGETEACITTETARKLYGLNKLKEFGAPIMLFTFGTTQYGVQQLMEIL